MRIVFRCMRANFIKVRRTAFLFLHLLFPVAGALVFASYFQVSGWGAAANVSAFTELLAVVFPFFAGLTISQLANLEEQAGNFQGMLSGVFSKSAFYLGEILFFILLEAAASALCLLLFEFAYPVMPIWFYFKIWYFLVIANSSIYLITLYIGFAFGKTAAVGIGIAGSLTAALMITGLGDAIWKWFPWAWGVRFVDYCMIQVLYPDKMPEVSAEYLKAFFSMIAITATFLGLSIVWFRYWEGRKENE